MTVRDVIFPSRAVAGAAVTAMRGGLPSPAAVAQGRGRDPGKVSGEEFYFAAKIHLGDRLFAAARAL